MGRMKKKKKKPRQQIAKRKALTAKVTIEEITIELFDVNSQVQGLRCTNI